MDVFRGDALLLEEGTDRPEHRFGILVVEIANDVLAGEGGGAMRYREDAVKDRVFVMVSEPLVVRGEVGEHALGVGAAVGGDQYLHGRLSGVLRSSLRSVRLVGLDRDQASGPTRAPRSADAR